MIAESLADMPFLSAINIADNNLTDDGFVPLLLAISKVLVLYVLVFITPFLHLTGLSGPTD